MRLLAPALHVQGMAEGLVHRLVKNPNYHIKGKPYIDEIYWQVIPDAPLAPCI